MTAATARNDAASTLTSMHLVHLDRTCRIAGLAFLAAEGPRALSVLQLVIAGMTIFVGAIVAAFSRRFMRSDPRRTSYFAQIALPIGSVKRFRPDERFTGFRRCLGSERHFARQPRRARQCAS